jgi:hypothetical protein
MLRKSNEKIIVVVGNIPQFLPKIFGDYKTIGTI